MPSSLKPDEQAALERLGVDTPFYARNLVKIVDKDASLVELEPNPGQLALDEMLEEQRAEGRPMRGIVLKARQIGFSTWIQTKLIQRATQRPNYNVLALAHDRETGGKLYKMGETIWRNLPDEPQIKPPIASHRRARELHFADTTKGKWESTLYPDSRYSVDTAGEFQAGRGSTFQAVHASECAFWEDMPAKLTALRNAVPRRPETMFILESTANGFNAFKDEWDRAEAGESSYFAFFWPWWKAEEYSLPFLNQVERDTFHVGEGAYGEEEVRLVEHFGLSIEQLNWRRLTIADECGGDLNIFHQEYPATPEEAFISTGQKVFDPFLTAGLIVKAETTDPRTPTPDCPGPILGAFEAGEVKTGRNRMGNEIEIATQALWVPRRAKHDAVPWRLWVERDFDGRPVLPEGFQCIIGVDVSGGKMAETDEPDWHAIEVIDHRTREQLAEYRSRCDPDLLTREILLAALYFNNALVAIERTGSWGLPMLRSLWFDIHYMRLYRSRKKDMPTEKTDHRLGWSTDGRTKPIMVAGQAELLRDDLLGVKSRQLAMEYNTYVRDEKGKMNAEPGKYDDLLIAHGIAQQVAAETPIRLKDGGGRGRREYVPRDPVTGY